MYEPARLSRQRGKAFEALAERYVRKNMKLVRPEGASKLTTSAIATLVALRPENRPSVLEAQTIAEGLWVDRSGTIIWVECSGTTVSDHRSGFRRPCTVRKIGGTLNAVLGVCNHWMVDRPKVVLITSHGPEAGTSGSEYLRWAVVEPFGRDNVELVEIDESGAARRLALPAESEFT